MKTHLKASPWKRSALLSLILGLLCCATHGQGENRTCRIICFDRPQGAPATMHLFDGTSTQEVEVPGMNLSKAYKLPQGRISLALLPAPLADPAQLPPGTPTVLVPEEATDVYLLVVYDPSKEDAPVSLHLADANAEQLRNGRTLWINLTKQEVSGTLGTQSLDLKPMARALTDAPRDDAGAYDVSLGYRVEGEEQLRTISETRWQHNPAARNLGFVIKKDASRIPRIFVLSDIREGE